MKKKIIIGTIASVFILCSVSTAVPAFTGSSARELINNANENVFLGEKYNSLINFFEIIQKKKDESYNGISSILDEKYTFAQNPILLQLLNRLKHNTEKYLQDGDSHSFLDVFTEIQHLNEEHEHNSGVNSISTTDAPSGFENWWSTYEQCKKKWNLGGLLTIDNYNDWYNWGINVLSILGIFIMVLYVLIAVSLGEAASYLWPFFAIWEIFLIYFVKTYTISSGLLVREIDIVVHVEDSESETGINGLNIYTYSLDVGEKTTQEEVNKFFNYTVEPATYMGDGYYALSSRDRETKYTKAPEPPGNYRIVIEEQYAEGIIWESFDHDTDYAIPDAGVYMLDVSLNATG
ncbi:MAG: hypothetical protein U9R21_02665 [Candidatus Thermoplasmatota archaeon]|nr:hypothetical protein [Candidatus Thermoplasmatota archaeon]